ncbi:exonuclease domain-containing protein [Pedobacter arcticus]|uniref:exonuclease domain-containing protein n=1 Tax=Pedobacter arcticus TaxID=752140 RepID=UPI00031B2126|nr:exonuclease domain-containing protein [Pedobacter arcticus]
MSRLYAIVDIETTGSHANANGITEIAIYIHDGENVVDEYQTLINPKQEIPVFIQSLTGINDEMVKSAPTFEEVAPIIFDYLDGRVFVAHNVNFDYSFINHHLKREGFTLNSKKLCTVRLARKILPGLPSYSLGKLCRSLNITIENRHRAAGDALATTVLFKMMVDADEHQYIDEALNAKTKEEVLPPYISRLQLEGIPRQPGVYYFKDKKDKIIYVGKAKNLYKRILSHFSNNDTHKNKQDFLREIRKISHQVCGTELQALILENVEIKRLWPEKNKAAKHPEKRFALYKYEDQNGYLRLAIGKKNKYVDSVFLFSSIAEAQRLMRLWCEKFTLCNIFCDLQKSNIGCIGLENKVCKGACILQEAVELYNQRVNLMIKEVMKELPSYLIVDQGRNKFEKSCILVEKGALCGMGYVTEKEVPTDLEIAKLKLTPYPSYLAIEKLLSDFVANHPQKQVLLN